MYYILSTEKDWVPRNLPFHGKIERPRPPHQENRKKVQMMREKRNGVGIQ